MISFMTLINLSALLIHYMYKVSEVQSIEYETSTHERVDVDNFIQLFAIVKMRWMDKHDELCCIRPNKRFVEIVRGIMNALYFISFGYFTYYERFDYPQFLLNKKSYQLLPKIRNGQTNGSLVMTLGKHNGELYVILVKDNKREMGCVIGGWEPDDNDEKDTAKRELKEEIDLVDYDERKLVKIGIMERDLGNNLTCMKYHSIDHIYSLFLDEGEMAKWMELKGMNEKDFNKCIHITYNQEIELICVLNIKRLRNNDLEVNGVKIKASDRLILKEIIDYFELLDPPLNLDIKLNKNIKSLVVYDTKI